LGVALAVISVLSRGTQANSDAEQGKQQNNRTRT
jgi:hypothetical protein